jgi:hypothetical protein
MTNDERIIELSKGKLLLLVIGAAVFVALGIWMYLPDSTWIESQPPFQRSIAYARDWNCFSRVLWTVWDRRNQETVKTALTGRICCLGT